MLALQPNRSFTVSSGRSDINGITNGQHCIYLCAVQFRACTHGASVLDLILAYQRTQFRFVRFCELFVLQPFCFCHGFCVVTHQDANFLSQWGTNNDLALNFSPRHPDLDCQFFVLQRVSPADNVDVQE